MPCRFVQAEGRRERRMRAQRGARFIKNLQYVKAWNSWWVVVRGG